MQKPKSPPPVPESRLVAAAPAFADPHSNWARAPAYLTTKDGRQRFLKADPCTNAPRTEPGVRMFSSATGGAPMQFPSTTVEANRPRADGGGHFLNAT